MRNLAAILAVAVMGGSAYLSAPQGPKTVSAAEANAVFGTQSCVTQGTPFTLCTLNQSCNPNVIPPVSGWGVLSNNGSPTSACYTPAQGTVYCPCGTTGYYVSGINSASCYTGS